jgi:hypothetical protein
MKKSTYQYSPLMVMFKFIIRMSTLLILMHLNMGLLKLKMAKFMSELHPEFKFRKKRKMERKQKALKKLKIYTISFMKLKCTYVLLIRLIQRPYIL